MDRALMAKPGSVPGAIRIKPTAKSDLTAYRSAKRLQDYINWEAAKDSMFGVGDLVSRDGSDAHLVERVYFGGMMLTVVCIRTSVEGWCELGEVENNLARRYERI